MRKLSRAPITIGLLALTFAASVLPAKANNVALPRSPFAHQVELTIQLGDYDGIYFIVPPDPPPPVDVLPGAKVTLVPAHADAAKFEVRWLKNNQAEPVHIGPSLILANVTAKDSATYVAQIQRNSSGGPFTTNPLRLRVGHPVGQQLCNLSTRVSVEPGAASATIGFVVGPPADSHDDGKWLLIRAVGPGLREFGVDRPVERPSLQLRDSAQAEYPLPTQAEPARQVSAQRAGAFPLPEGSADVQSLVRLPSGAYTLHVRDAGGVGGEVLVEIYELPEPSYLSPLK